MKALTSKYLPGETDDGYRHLALVVDGELVCAPRITVVVSERACIHARLEESEAESVVDRIRVASLLSRLALESVQMVNMAPESEADNSDSELRRGRTPTWQARD